MPPTPLAPTVGFWQGVVKAYLVSGVVCDGPPLSRSDVYVLGLGSLFRSMRVSCDRKKRSADFLVLHQILHCDTRLRIAQIHDHDQESGILLLLYPWPMQSVSVTCIGGRELGHRCTRTAIPHANWLSQIHCRSALRRPRLQKCDFSFKEKIFRNGRYLHLRC